MQILTIPNTILTSKAEEVTDLNYAAELFTDMKQVAIDNNLIGLAANQVGILQRVFIMDVTKGMSEIPDFEIFINPKTKVNQAMGKEFDLEGCGSIPNTKCLVERWKGISVTYTNLQGENCIRAFTGLLARTVQHEVQHLDGILMTSKARQIIRGK